MTLFQSHQEYLNSMLEDPSEPRWSSHMIKEMFGVMEGTMKEKQQIVLPLIMFIIK